MGENELENLCFFESIDHTLLHLILHFAY